jgi:hypothetical protein
MHRFITLSLIVLLTSASGCGTTRSDRHAETNPMLLNPEYRPPEDESGHVVPKKETNGVWHTTLWYLPNRVFDLIDIFRFRLRAGPGLAANVRVTDYANVFIGRYHTAFLGLPGPRMGPEFRWPVGWEQERGIMLMGVDATDDLAHDPGYSRTEFNLGLQLLIVGGEVGFDPVELGDFLAGFLLYDLREDDR